MKFTLSRELMLHALTRLQGLADRKLIGQTSGGLQMVCEQGKLRILATDGDIYLQQDLPEAEVEKEGKAIVATRVIHDIVRYADANSVLTVENQGQNLSVNYGSASFHLNLITDAEAAMMPQVTEGHSLTLASSLLSRIFKQVNFAASKDKVCRPFLCGVHWHFEQEKLVALATDGFRLARKTTGSVEIKSPSGVTVPGIIIPSKAVAEAQKILEEKEVDITVTFDRHIIKFQFPNAEMCARLVDANYPDCDAIFPKEEDRTARLYLPDVGHFITIVERIASVSLDKKEPLKISLQSDGPSVLSTTDRATGSATEKFIAEYQGESVEIGFNGRYLLDILKCIPSNKVLVWPGKSNEPILIKDQADRNLEYLLMPMQT